jgi:hypothetical protein
LVLVHFLLKVFLVLFTLIAVLISLKTVVVHRVEGASLRAVLLKVAGPCYTLVHKQHGMKISQYSHPFDTNNKACLQSLPEPPRACPHPNILLLYDAL